MSFLVVSSSALDCLERLAPKWPVIGQVGQKTLLTQLKFTMKYMKFVFSVFSLCCCLVVSTSEIDYLESLVFEMTFNVSSGTLNPAHSLT